MNLINTRESQFELLRIVAIFMVLIHHSLAVADTFGYTGHYTLNEGITGVLLNVSIRPRACFFPLFSFLPLWLHYNLNPLCVQY